MVTTPYTVRRATLDDRDVLTRHRIEMFVEMGLDLARDELSRSFQAWLAEAMPAGIYHAWLVEAGDGAVVSGGGMTLIPWPPGPRYPDGRVAFAYNVYTEPEHRRRGLGQLVMDTMHAYCRDIGVNAIVLNASAFGKPMYEAMGYRETESPMMFLGLS
jgi:GNAT superfamily N-acetyltransferase